MYIAVSESRSFISCVAVNEFETNDLPRVRAALNNE